MFLITRYLKHKKNEIKYKALNKELNNLEKKIKELPCKTWKKNTIERKECKIREKQKKKQKNKKKRENKRI